MRTIVTITALGFFVSAAAQNVPASIDGAAVHNKSDLTGFEILNLHPPSTNGNTGNRIINDSIIGETFYDLQSNASVQNRCIRHLDGTNSAAWTFSSETSSSFTDRGTNYNYFDGTAWGPISYNRIENEKTGWPSLLYTTGGTEITIAHTSNGQLLKSSRTGKGSGTFAFNYVTSNISNGYLWPRAAVGGASGNTIHLVALTEPVANGGTRYQGLDGALLYFRSQDQGATWDIIDSLIPGTGDSLKFNGFRGDGYTIVANGDNVAIVSFNEWGDSWYAKSTDNGDTWSFNTYLDFPIDDYEVDDGSDWDNDGMFDTLVTTDGSGCAIIDDLGGLHIFYGNMRVIDSDTTDGNTSFFPATNGLRYWNEGMTVNNAVIITGAEDVDGNGTIDIASPTVAEIPGYFISLSSMPSAGLNADGTIFLAYASFMESIFTANQNYRHIYLMKSIDGGANWTQPVDVTPDLDLLGIESVFPTMADFVDNKVRFWTQQDFEPGLAVRGDMDAIALNEIHFYEVDTVLSQDVGIQKVNGNFISANVYPNPSVGTLTLELGMKKSVTGKIYITDMVGKVVMEVYKGKLLSGEQLTTIDMTGLSEGVYNVIVETGMERMNKQFVLTK